MAQSSALLTAMCEDPSSIPVAVKLFSDFFSSFNEKITSILINKVKLITKKIKQLDPAEFSILQILLVLTAISRDFPRYLFVIIRKIVEFPWKMWNFRWYFKDSLRFFRILWDSLSIDCNFWGFSRLFSNFFSSFNEKLTSILNNKVKNDDKKIEQLDPAE